MRYLSVCSGIEAASVAWEPLGWEPVAFAEIEAFPSAVLAHHFPHVPNLGDMTEHETWSLQPGSIDLLVGGTPCQSFSVAGLRQGLHDPRGGLMLTYLALAQRLRPRWIVWENVPGVLSSSGGRDFGSFLGALEQLGYGWAYRVLDAQYVRTHGQKRAVPQRRRRVFAVGYFGESRRAAEVLFESESVRGNTSSRGKARQGAAGDVAGSLGASSGGSRCKLEGHGAYIPEMVGTLSDGAHMGGGLNEQDAYTGRIIAQPVAFQVGNLIRIGAGSKPNTEVFPTLKGSRSNSDQEPCVAFTSNLGTRGGDVYDDGSCPTVRVGSGIGIPSPPAVAFDARQSDVLQYGPISGPLDTDGQTIGILASAAVRRLTPRECERLQGFPDDWTLVPWRGKPASDGPRYRAIGNSMAVNCMEWIGQRIADVEART